MEDALGRLDRLTQEEVRVAAGQGLKATNEVDIKVQAVDDKVQGVDDKVQDVGDKVQDVDDKVQSVDDRVQGVDDRVRGVDDRVRDVDNKIDLVINNAQIPLQLATRTALTFFPRQAVIKLEKKCNKSQTTRDVRYPATPHWL